MGTTLTALKAGNIAIQRVLAIEGFPYLVTHGATAPVVTAWAGSGYTQAIGGLTVEGRTEQALEWRTPIRPVGIVTFHVHPGARDSATYDLLGKAVHKRDAGYESKLTSTFKPGDTTMNVVSTTGSPAAPGAVFVGNSCIAYTGKTATTFTGCTSKYVPVGTFTDDTAFKRNHRVANYEFHAPLQPTVSEFRRRWEGAWVTLTAHRRLGSVLDVKAQAQRLFAGRIVSVRYDSRTGCIAIECEHVINYLAETTVLQDQYVGRVREGIYLWAGMTLADARDWNGATEEEANALTVVTSGAAGTNQVDAGWYTLAELVDKLNAWLQGEKIATRLHGTYSFTAPAQSDAGPRTELFWRVDGTAPASANFTIFLSPRVVHFLGFADAPATNAAIEGSGQVDEEYFAYSPFEPLRLLLGAHFDDGGGASTRIVSIEASSGAFVAQSTMLPPGAADIAAEALGSWGLFQIDRFVVIGRYVSATEIDYVQPVTELNEGWATTNLHEFLNASFGRRATDPAPLEVRQIFVLEGLPATVITALVCSTGTASYNSAGHDVLGAALGQAVPYGLLSEGGATHTFADSITALPEGGDTIRVWITKPIKLRELLSGDLIIRRAHLVWRNGGLEFVTQPSPTVEHAVHTLTEANKARPTDTTDQNPSDMVESEEGIANHIVLKYSLDFSLGSYKGTRNIEDPESIDALGGRRFELQLPNIHGDTVEALIPRFMAGLPQISRPYWKLERSIDFRFFEDVAPGDIALVTDLLAYDPATGLHGITSRAGVIMKHAVDFGGAMPGSKPGTKALPAIGEVTVVFQDVDRVGPYCPAAQVDDTQNAGGFSSGYNNGTTTLRCYAHRYSHTTDAVDPLFFQTVGRKLRILELDPAGGVSDSWDRDSAGGSGNDVILSAALAAPAWNAAKRYVIVSQPYASADATQKSKASQADDADLRVQDLRAPFRWGYMANPFSKLVVHTDLPERYSSSSYGDGVALDVAHEHGVALLLNNFIDHRSALNSPFLDNTIRSAVDRAPPASSDYVLCFLRRIYVGPHKLPGGGAPPMARKIEVGPWARASSASASKLRVTLSRFAPIENPAGAAAINVLFQSPKAQAEWTGIVSTTWSELTPAELDIRVADPAGYAWLSIELTNVAQSRGCSRLRLQARDE